MEGIVFLNRQAFVVREFNAAMKPDHLVFYWEENSWGTKRWPLANSVEIVWVKNYAVKKKLFVKYKDSILFNECLEIRPIAEIMNIYNLKSTSELEAELKTKLDYANENTPKSDLSANKSKWTLKSFFNTFLNLGK